MLWLINRRWWILAGAFMLLLLGLVLLPAVRSIPDVVVFLLFWAMLGAVAIRREAPRPPGSN
jgi:hypothetical protein